MASWDFVRTNLFAPKNRQRVRLNCDVPPMTGICAWNHQHWDGRYRRWWCSNGNVLISSSHDAGANFEFTANCTYENHCSEPRGTYDRLGVLYLLYTYDFANTPEVRERFSFDDGKTWSEATVAFTGGTHPTISAGLDGTIIRAAYVSGVISATRQEPGTLSVDAIADQFNFKDDLGVDLDVADDSFQIVQGLRTDAPWMLIVTIDGETEPSDWISSDDCKTWKRV